MSPSSLSQAGPAADDCCAPSAGLDPTLDADGIAALGKALAEPVRVQILDVVRRSEKPVCQCELIALFEIKQSLLAHHIRKLTDAGLLLVERRHKWAYYSLADGAFAQLSAFLP
jgi:ArsR family transcriptional regulator, arsenate/arsenite/antimonite-responsive transcriptional repressor